jgi:hypothetical protein
MTYIKLNGTLARRILQVVMVGVDRLEYLPRQKKEGPSSRGQESKR